jgi:hypothetical protein
MCLHTTERLKRLSFKQNKSTPKKKCKHQEEGESKDSTKEKWSEVNERARASPVCQLAPIASSGELAAEEEENKLESKHNCIKQRASSGSKRETLIEEHSADPTFRTSPEQQE